MRILLVIPDANGPDERATMPLEIVDEYVGDEEAVKAILWMAYRTLLRFRTQCADKVPA